MPRPYTLGRRQAAVDRTARAILAAATQELEAEPAAALSVAKVARRAGVTRATVYNRFGSRSGLIRCLAPPAAGPEQGSQASDPREGVRGYLMAACSSWAAHPALYRHLPAADAAPDRARELAEALARADELRPGCSLREAEDVLAALGSFPVFDRLHRDGRRTPAAVADILFRLAGGILE